MLYRKLAYTFLAIKVKTIHKDQAGMTMYQNYINTPNRVAETGGKQMNPGMVSFTMNT